MSKQSLKTQFRHPKPIIGMIHVGALPGTPASRQSMAELLATAVHEARLYREAGLDGAMLENMHDTPYLRGSVGPEIVAAMTLLAQAVKTESGLPTGIQILAGANLEALAVAHVAGLDFMRAEAFAFAHVADEGWLDACAGPLLRYRKQLGAERVQIWADIKKKHSAHVVTADVSLGATADTVEFMRGDAVIITGSVTGDPPQLADVAEAKAHCRLPILLGSGVNAANLATFYPTADGFIIGSAFKADGHWANPVDPARVEALLNVITKLRHAV